MKIQLIYWRHIQNKEIHEQKLLLLTIRKTSCVNVLFKVVAFREYRSNIEILINSEKDFKTLEVKANNQRTGILLDFRDKKEKEKEFIIT